MTTAIEEDIRIHAIKSENYMRTKLVELKFNEDENFVEICGNNGEGKEFGSFCNYGSTCR